MNIDPDWSLALALLLLMALGTGALVLGRLKIAGQVPWAGIRAAVQLLLISYVIGWAVSSPGWAFALVGVMFAVGVFTTARRVGLDSPRAWASAALAMAAGTAPVLAIIFGTGAAPLTGAAIIPLAGILVGNMMTAHTLFVRHALKDLRTGYDMFEARLALGFHRRFAIREVVRESVAEALIPALDQTRTAGLVSLPGAYIGVLLGGGTPLEAGAAQLLVLVGVIAGQPLTALAARELMSLGWLLPRDVERQLHS
ncbi:MAG: ABC transporter permease [Propionibacteriaceae bacterium]|nr:ABC transporter permease [Propionibacteriaceae bacterium]